MSLTAQFHALACFVFAFLDFGHSMPLTFVLGQRGFLGFGVLSYWTMFLVYVFLKGFSAFSSYSPSVRCLGHCY